MLVPFPRSSDCKKTIVEIVVVVSRHQERNVVVRALVLLKNNRHFDLLG